MKAISVRPIWAWLIINGFKDIENRTWRTKYRGAILIHASAKLSMTDYHNALHLIQSHGLGIQLPEPAALPRGGVVGLSCIAGCVSQTRSPWFIGPHGFELESARQVPFSPVKGRLGIFDVDLAELARETRHAITQECVQ